MKKGILYWLKNTHLGVSTCCTICLMVGLGLGLFMGIDSQDAKVKKVEAEKRILIRDLTQAEFIITLLDLKLSKLNKLLFKWLEKDDRIKKFNNIALEDG